MSSSAAKLSPPSARSGSRKTLTDTFSGAAEVTTGCAAAGGYTFVPGVDEVVRAVADPATGGWVVSFGDALYRALDAVERLRAEGVDVGLINKPTLNVADEASLAKVGAGAFVVVAESLSRKNGLGVRYGTWLLERGFGPKYARIGTHRDGSGGLWEQAYHQGYDADSILAKVRELAAAAAK